MKWVNPTTQSTTVPKIIDGTTPPTPEQLLRAGFRMWDETEPALAPGYERLSRWFIQDPGTPSKAIMAVTDGSIAEREAREEAERQARAAERAAYQALKDAVQAIDASLIDKTPFADAAQKATIVAIKDAVKATKDALRRIMVIVQP